MKLVKTFKFEEFEPWYGAVQTYDTIANNGKKMEFEEMVNAIYPDGTTATEVNDFMRFESDLIFQALGISKEYDD